MSTKVSSRAGQCGQSTVEFVVLSLVLVPLFLALPLLGKYMDMMQTAEVASRYVAFEGQSRNSSSTWKTDSELAGEVRRRFFSNSAAAIKTGDVAGDFPEHRNPLWTDPKGDPLIAKFEDSVGVRTEVTGLNPISAAMFADPLNLSKMNLYTAAVIVKPANVVAFEPFDKIDLSTRRRTVLLTDAWAARSADTVRSKIESSVLTLPISKAKGLVGGLGELPRVIFDPALKVGNFDWDVVPCDRLIGGC